jgi:F-type H+-transporting ATPase subunit gamma
MYRDGEIDEILISHTVYVNTLRQEVHVDRLLPIDPDQHDHSDQHLSYLEYEPSSQEVFDYLILKYLEMTLFSATIESATCEHAARRQAMENANDNASDMLNALQIKYNRARQSKITDEIIEIVSGSEAQS